MTTPILRGIAAAVAEVAPEIDLADVDGDELLRDELDIDSMDFLKVVVGIKRELGVDIPEEHYPQVETLDELVGYLEARVSTA